jgi:6-phosphogluconolactonase (cycloisomerase 2 family)
VEINQPGWLRTFTGTAFVSELLDGSSGALGLDGASSIAATADGRFVFVAGATEAKIQRFARDATNGMLTPLGTTATTEQISGVNVLQGIVKMVVAPVATSSGLYLYALSSDGALAVFDINTTTGDLTLSDVVRNGDAAAIRGNAVSRMIGSTGLAVSPDGLRVYVSNFSANAQNGGTLLAFERVPTLSPQLRLRRILNNGVGNPPISGAGGRGVAAYGNQVYVVGETADTSDTLATFTLAASPLSLNYTAVLRNGVNGVSGLDGANDIAISSDGKFVYVSAGADGSVTVFARDTAGVLTFVQSLAEGGADDAGNVIGGVQEASSVAISADGSRVYVTGRKYFDDFGLSIGAVAVFRRDPLSGRLTFLHSLVDSVPDPFGAPIENIETAVDVFATAGYTYVISGGDEDALTVFRRDGEGLDRRVLLVGEELVGVHFSSAARPAEIRGSVYHDFDSDGFRDIQSDTGLANGTLYLDMNQNGILDAGEPTASTDGAGDYRFTDLTPLQTYTVRFAPQQGQDVTFPSVSSNREWEIVAQPDEVYNGVDFFVNSAIGGEGQNSQIQGKVVQDTDGDGVLDPGELGIVGRTVFLDDDDDGILDATERSTVTGGEGAYTFTGLRAANYVVRLVPLPGETTTRPAGNTFEKQSFIAGANTLGIVTADFDGDGDLDLATADNVTNEISVRLQIGLNSGTFGPQLHNSLQIGSQPSGLAVGRFDNDADYDIAVVHQSLSRIVLLSNNGNGTFTKSPTEIPIPIGVFASIVSADFDNDGDDDLAVAIDGAADKVAIRINNGGNFLAAADINVGRAPLSIAAGHLNGDLLPDLVVGNFLVNPDRPSDNDTVQIIFNAGGGSFHAPNTFTTFTVGDGPTAVAIADIDGLNGNDVIVANIGSNSISRLHGNGTGGFTAQSPVVVGGGPRAVGAGDIDGDNDTDLIVGTSLSNDILIVRNVGGTFAFAESTGLASFAGFAAPGVKSVIVQDINDDGRLDVAAARGDFHNGSFAFLANEPFGGSHRIVLDGANEKINQDFGVHVDAPPLPGDFDGDRSVDAADHTVWRTTFSATGSGLAADANRNGFVDAADYVIWRKNLGATSAGGSVTTSGRSAAAAETATPASTDVILARSARDEALTQFTFESSRDSVARRSSRGILPREVALLGETQTAGELLMALADSKSHTDDVDMAWCDLGELSLDERSPFESVALRSFGKPRVAFRHLLSERY